MKDNYPFIDGEILPAPVDKDLYCDECWRVKIFELNPENTWMDRGTGLTKIIQQVVFIKNLQDDKYFIHVVSDVNGDEMINSRILEDTYYTRQKDTIVTWHDDLKGQDVALSFQEIEDTKRML